MVKIIPKPATGWPIEAPTTHPGAILREDFLAPMGLSAHQLALRTRMPATRIGEILHERRAVSPDTALRLARFFGTSAEFWLNLQAAPPPEPADLLPAVPCRHSHCPHSCCPSARP
jgi:addiction module HigA family antidote